jgi:hypothetical protein
MADSADEVALGSIAHILKQTFKTYYGIAEWNMLDVLKEDDDDIEEPETGSLEGVEGEDVAEGEEGEVATGTDDELAAAAEPPAEEQGELGSAPEGEGEAVEQRPFRNFVTDSTGIILRTVILVLETSTSDFSS